MKSEKCHSDGVFHFRNYLLDINDMILFGKKLE